MLDEMRLIRTESATQARELNTKIDGVHKYVVQEFKEIRETQTEILSRLATGSERMDNLERRLTSVEQGGATTALTPRKKPEQTTGRLPINKRKTPPWWVVAAAGGALAFAGERAYRWVAFVASQEPPAVTHQPSKP